MDVRVLGPLEVIVDGRDVTPSSPSQRTILAVLASAEGRHVSADTLIDALWPSDPPPTAHRTLRSYISRLRSTLGPAITASAGGFHLDNAGLRVDAAEFESAVTAARNLSAQAAVSALTSALRSWRGEALGEFDDLPAVRTYAARLASMRITALDMLADAQLACGDAASAIVTAESLTADLPLHENAWSILITALATAGRAADALDAYRRAHRALVDAGLEPSARLREVQRLAFDPPTPVATPPIPPSRLLGRDDDLTGVLALIEQTDLVTLVGPGGVGKTTLAHEVIRHRTPAHSGGSRFVDLAAVTDPAAVPDAIITALAITGDSGDRLAVLGQVRNMDLCVVLDNCEHVLDAVCEVLQVMLSPSPAALRVVATSRELIGMPSEHAWPVAPLDTSTGESPAQQFFRRRALAARPGSITGADDPAVTAIVRQLDGLPLAIELAAARVATLGVDELAEQIGQSVSGHSGSGTGPSEPGTLSRRGGVPRHRTLRAAIEWSEKLLEPAERDVLSQWTVFAGAVRLDDAQAVLHTTAAVIDALAARSLLSIETRSGRTCYRMLQTVRSTVAPFRTETAVAHLEHFAAVAHDCAARLQTTSEGAAHERLTDLLDELRVAHIRARDIDVAAAVRLSMDLHIFGVSRLHTELLGWAAKLSPLVHRDPAPRADVDSSLAYRHVIAEQIDSARERALGALRNTVEDTTRCRALEALADAALFRGDLADAEKRSADLATAGARSGQLYYELLGDGGLAMARAYGNDGDGAVRHLALLDTKFSALPLSPTQRSWLEYFHGEVVLDRDPDAALTRFTRSIELADTVGSRYVAGVARVSAISLQSRTTSPRTALRLYQDVIEHWLAAGSWSHLLTTLRNLVPTLTEVECYGAATELLGAVSRPAHTPSYGQELDRLHAAEVGLRRALGDTEFAVHHARGLARDLPAAGRRAAEAIRVTLDASLQPVEAEDVVFDVEHRRPVEPG